MDGAIDDAKEGQGLPTGVCAASHDNAVVLAGSLSPGARGPRQGRCLE